MFTVPFYFTDGLFSIIRGRQALDLPSAKERTPVTL